jgi:hypothetical protein
MLYQLTYSRRVQAKRPADNTHWRHQAVQRSIAPPHAVSSKGLPELLAVRYLGERLALLLAPARGLRRIAERDDS